MSRPWPSTRRATPTALVPLLLLAASSLCHADSISGGTLELGALTQGFAKAPSIALYSLSVEQCRSKGYVLLELISPNVTASELGAANFASAPSAQAPQGANSSSVPDFQWTESTSLPDGTLLGLMSSEYGMPLLLLNAQGGVPDAQIVRPYYYDFNENTYPVDFPDYQAQELVQFQMVKLSPQASTGISDDWTLGVMSDYVLGGQRILPFFIRASCPDALPCPGNCGGPSRGMCSSNGTCVCNASWGGAACFTRMGDLAGDQGKQLTLAPRQWMYYSFQVPPPYANVLLEVNRSCQGNPEVVIFMKQASQGFLVGGVPTEYDFFQFSDQLAYKYALPYKHIMWERAPPGLAYVGILNGGDSPCNFTFELQMDTDDLETNTVKLCPRNCSFPSGECFSNSSLWDTDCMCDSRHAGPSCEGRLYDAAVDSPLSGILAPTHTVYFRLSYGNDQGLSVLLEHAGGHLFVMLGKDGEAPTLASPDVLQLPIISPDTVEKSVISIDDIAEAGTVILGLYNSDRFITQNASVRVQFFYEGQSERSFLQSPYMITVLVVLGVVLVVGLGFGFRRLLSRPPPLMSDQYMLPTPLQTGVVDPPGCPQGLPRDVISSFPIVPFREDDFTVDENQCAVCLTDYEEGERVRKLPHCHHIFHVACVDRWLATHDTCPMCRSTLTPLLTTDASLSRSSSTTRMLDSPSRSDGALRQRAVG